MRDIVEIGHEFGLKDSVFVGHSVSCMIGALAAQKAPGVFGKLVMIGPSARYIDDADYLGGFSEKQIEELLQSNWAICWHASVGAALSCDTFLITDEGARALTTTDRWPLRAWLAS